MQNWGSREAVTAVLLLSLVSPVSNREASPLLLWSAEGLAGQAVPLHKPQGW